MVMVPLRGAKKFKETVYYPPGKVTIQQSPAATGKSIRAEAWRKEDPESRRVIDGDRNLAEAYAKAGFDVMLNLLPGM